jgi:hypothetical protein
MQYSGNGCLDPLMGIGNGQLDAAQTAPSELAPELRPEGLDLRWSDIHSEHFAPAVSVDAHRYDHRSETMRQLSRTFT